MTTTTKLATEAQMAYMRDLLSRPTAFNKSAWQEGEPYWSQWTVAEMSREIDTLRERIERDWLYRQSQQWASMSDEERAAELEALSETW